MLHELRRLVDTVSEAQSLSHTLRLIVSGVSALMQTEVCSVYLQEQDALVLRANEGFAAAAVGAVRLAPGEGLVGLVAERAALLNLDDAQSHPHYRFFPAIGEEVFHAFLGVPIVHQRRVLGVLVVQQRQRRRFDASDEAVLVTLSAQLAGALALAEMSGALAEDAGRPSLLHGLPGAPGVGIGIAVVAYPPADLDAVPDRACVDKDHELELFRGALARTLVEIAGLAATLRPRLAGDEAELFDAYRALLDDASLRDDVETLIRAGLWAPAALRTVIQNHAQIFDAMSDSYLRERAADLRDLGTRILAHLSETLAPKPVWQKHTILVAEEVSAALLAEVPRDKLLGIVSLSGSVWSHAAILARALGVATVMGLSGIPASRLAGRELIVDGHSGRVHISPAPALRAEFARLARAQRAELSHLKRLRDLPAETADGHRITLLLNTGLAAELPQSRNAGAAGIGLYRTEIPFMVAESFPSETEQYTLYRHVLSSCPDQPVVMRLLDIGGDKALPYFPIREANPFLGWRGIRLTLDHPELFLMQARALLKANAGLGNLHILLPMLTELAEVDAALTLLQQANSELYGSEQPLPPIGAMIEVPAAALLAGRISARVDFLSVGTNDLTQYLLAVDRNNPRVAALYDSLHPAVLHQLIAIAAAARLAGKPAHVCGELAGDPVGAILLMAMGYDALSMNAANIPRIKAALRAVRKRDADALLAQARHAASAEAVRAPVRAYLEHAGLPVTY